MERVQSEENKYKQLLRETGAFLCVDCGKCTASCPVAISGVHYSPRLIVSHLLYHHRSPVPKEIWRCLTCSTCRYRCPSDVDFPGFVQKLRGEIRKLGNQPQPTHTGMIGEMVRIMSSQPSMQKRTDWLPQWVKVISGREVTTKSEDVYFVGCAPYFDVIFDEFELDLTGTHIAALNLLRITGVEPAVLADEVCCGHDSLWAGDFELFERLAQTNAQKFKAVGAKRIYVSCPECYFTLKHSYGDYLSDAGIEIINTISYLAKNLNIPQTNGKPTRITYHDSCRMGRLSSLYSEPRELLMKVPGLEIVEMELSQDRAQCCGSNLWINCDEVSKKLQQDLLDQASRTNTELMLTSCDKCRIHLTCAQLENGDLKISVQTDNILRFLYRKGVKKD